MATLEFGGKNGSGKFGFGNGDPAGIGFTSSGVTITISSLLALVLLMDWKNFPRIGTSPRNGSF